MDHGPRYVYLLYPLKQMRVGQLPEEKTLGLSTLEPGELDTMTRPSLEGQG